MMKKTKKGFKSLAILLALVLAIGFSPATNVSAKTAPRLNYKKVTIVQGKKKRLKVKGTKKKVKWSSTKKSVVTVNKKGVIKAKKKGKATIIAKIGKKKLKCKVTVKKKPAKKKSSKKTSKKVSVPKKDKKQIPYYSFSFLPEKSYAVGTSLDFFTTLIDPYGKDESHISDSIRAKYFKWYSSNKSVISFNSKGIASFKKVGTARVYCKHLNRNGKWDTTRTVSVKVFEGGNVKFSYSLSLEDSPFKKENYYVWDFQHEDPVKPNPAEPKFNTITLRVQNNSSKDIRLEHDLRVGTNTSQPEVVWMVPANKKDIVIPANSETTIKFYTYYANGSFGKVYYNYIIDKKVFTDCTVSYYYGNQWVGAENKYGSSSWKIW